MGRTVFPFNHVMEKEKETWSAFRKAMSKEDQEAFDRLFNRAKFHTHAAVNQPPSFSMETILLSICLEHEKIVEESLRQLEEKEPAVRDVFASLHLRPVPPQVSSSLPWGRP